MGISERNIRNIGIYALPKVLGYCINFITLPILTRILVPEDFGVVILASIFPAVAVSIVTCGMAPATQRYYFEYRNDKEKLNALYFSAQAFLYFFLIISSVAVFFLKSAISWLIMKNNTYGMAIFIMYIATYLGQIVNFYLLQYQNMEKARVSAFFTIMLAICSAALNILLVWCFKMSFMGLIYGLLASTSIACLILFFYFNKDVKVCFNMSILLENIRYGLQVSPKSLTGFISKFFDKYMLNNMISLSAVGIYNIGQTVGNSLFLMMNTVWSSIQPECYKQVFDRGDEASEDIGRLFTIFAFMTLLPLFFLTLFAQELIALVAPLAYHAAINVIVVVLFGIAANIFGMYAGVQYAYSKRPVWIFPITVIGVIVNVLANIVLIPRFELMGAAGSMCLSFFVTNFLLVVFGQRLYHIAYEWPKLAALFIHIAMCGIVVLFCRYQSLNGPVLYLIKIFMAGVFIFIGWRCRIITRGAFRKVMSAFLRPVPVKTANVL